MGRLAGGFLPVPKDPQPSTPMCEQPFVCLHGCGCVASEALGGSSSALMLWSPVNTWLKPPAVWALAALRTQCREESGGGILTPRLVQEIPTAGVSLIFLLWLPNLCPGHSPLKITSLSNPKDFLVTKGGSPGKVHRPTPSTSGQWSCWKDCLVRAVRVGPGGCVWQRGHWSGISPSSLRCDSRLTKTHQHICVPSLASCSHSGPNAGTLIWRSQSLLGWEFVEQPLGKDAGSWFWEDAVHREQAQPMVLHIVCLLHPHRPGG